MDLSLPADHGSKQSSEKRGNNQNWIQLQLDEFKQSVEQDLSLKQEDFHKVWMKQINYEYGPAIEDTNELPYLVRKMPPPQPPKPEVLTAPP